MPDTVVEQNILCFKQTLTVVFDAISVDEDLQYLVNKLPLSVLTMKRRIGLFLPTLKNYYLCNDGVFEASKSSSVLWCHLADCKSRSKKFVFYIFPLSLFSLLVLFPVSPLSLSLSVLLFCFVSNQFFRFFFLTFVCFFSSVFRILQRPVPIKSVPRHSTTKMRSLFFPLGNILKSFKNLKIQNVHFP